MHRHLKDLDLAIEKEVFTLGAGEIDQLVSEAEQYREDDQARGELAELRNQLALAGVPLSHELNKLTVSLALKFAGEILEPTEIDALLSPTNGGAPQDGVLLPSPDQGEDDYR